MLGARRALTAVSVNMRVCVQGFPDCFLQREAAEHPSAAKQAPPPPTVTSARAAVTMEEEEEERRRRCSVLFLLYTQTHVQKNSQHTDQMLL